MAGTPEQTGGDAGSNGAGRGPIIAWCVFDWANTAYPSVIITFVFAAYFTHEIAPNPDRGTELWGNALSLSALAVALFGPIFGAIADRSGRRKPWLFAFSLLCIGASTLLWWMKPGPASLLPILVLVAVGLSTFELGHVFYNSMLPEVAPKAMIGRISGWGWAAGYGGGLCCLILTLVLFVEPKPPLFGLEKSSAEQVRIIGPFVGLWFAVFAVPLFVFVPDRPSTGVPLLTAIGEGLQELVQTVKSLARHHNTLRFLLARLFYTDGLNTLFAFSGVYAAGQFGMSIQEILFFAIAVNVAAGLGAMGFAWVDDWIGPRRTVLISLVALILLGVPILLIETRLWLYILGAAIGLFAGPAQSASRSLMARLAPAEIRTTMFGVYALAGKSTAFFGPALLGWVTLWADSQRIGMATIQLFLIAGLLLLLPVREPPR